MQILGYNTWLHKYIAFIIAGGFGGLAGVLWAHTNGHVSPETVVLTTSVDALLMVVLGGAGTLVGATIGTAIVFGLREYLSTLVPWWQYVLGGVYVLTILYLPMGLMGIPVAHPAAAEHRKAKATVRRNWHRSLPDLQREGHGNKGGLTMTNKLQKMLLGSCLALGLAATAPAGAEELRIGFIAPMTGIFAQVGKDMVDGFQLYLDEHGGKLGGMDVKFIVEDDQGKPDTGVTKAKKLILQDKVHMFIGGLLASTGYALAPVSTAEKTLYISSVSSADDLTQRQLGKYPYFIRTSWTQLAAASPARPVGLRPGLQESHRHRRRLCVRLRSGRRLPDGVRGLRRQGHPENLAAARHQGLRALYPDHQGRRRRDLHHSWSARWRCNSPSSCAAPATRSRSSAAASAMTSSCCRSWATK